MRNYYKLVFGVLWKDFKTATGEQVIGALLVVGILACQIHYGLIKTADIRANFWSISWPYALLIAGLFIWHLLRAPWKVHQEQERVHSEQMQLANTQINSLQEKVRKVEELRPKIVPVKYGKAEGRLQMGLYVRNAGYDAIDVEIPSVPVGDSGYTLEFLGKLAQLGERTNIEFLEAWLNHGKLPGRDGSHLHALMSESKTASVPFSIVYKDTDLRPRKTDCIIEIDQRERGGLGIRAIGVPGVLV